MSIGVWQVVLILVIVLIIFGAGKLPRVMGDVAKGVRNFKKGMNEDADDEEQTKPEALKSEATETVSEPAAKKEEASQN